MKYWVTWPFKPSLNKTINHQLKPLYQPNSVRNTTFFKLSDYIFIFNKISLLFHPIFLNLTCAYPYLYNLMLTASYVYRPYSLSSKSSGQKCSVIFRYKSIRHVWHTGDEKSKYYDHIILLYLQTRRCRYRSIIFACFYLYITVVIFIDYSDIDKMMDINNEKC